MSEQNMFAPTASYLAYMSDREANTANITPCMVYLGWGFHNTWVPVRVFLFESLLYELWNLCAGGHGCVFVSLLLKHDSSESAKEWKLPGSVLNTGKWNESYDWSACSKCRSWLAVAQPHKIASCWWTLSCPQDTGTHRHENEFLKWFINLYLFVCNDFIQPTWA